MNDRHPPDRDAPGYFQLVDYIDDYLDGTPVDFSKFTVKNLKLMKESVKRQMGPTGSTPKLQELSDILSREIESRGSQKKSIFNRVIGR